MHCGSRRRKARIAACMLAPVASPSSTKITVRSPTSGEVSSPRYAFSRRCNSRSSSLRNSLDDLRRNAERSNRVVVEHANAAGGDCAEREFFAPGCAQFAHDENIERRMKCQRDFITYGNSAARKRQHARIAVRISSQSSSQSAVPRRCDFRRSSGQDRFPSGQRWETRRLWTSRKSLRTPTTIQSSTAAARFPIRKNERSGSL